MSIDPKQADILATTCDLLVVTAFRGAKRLSGAAAIVDKALHGAITELIAERAFEGKLGERIVFPTFHKMKARHIAVIGLGDRDALSADTIRKLGGFIVRAAREHHAGSAAIALSGVAAGNVDPRSAAQALAEGLSLGAHPFHLYKGTQHKHETRPRELRSFSILEQESKSIKAAEEGIRKGEALAHATMLAMDLVNTPSSDMTPSRLAEEAQKLATRGSGITCKILDQKTMERMGMRAALAVARGSMHAPVGVHLRYKPAGAKKSVAVVGKAVTFDSGGLSIKPADGMMTMKIDMAAAASVIGLFHALSALKPHVEVHGIFLAVENMPSGSAYRPGDVVRAMDGTTIEILNTDAEGRVTLADALAYAKKQDPDMIIDLATLTGACVVALGEEIAGLLSNNKGLAQKLLTAAEESGEPLWELPLFEPYARHVRSKIADIKNIGGGHGAGTITAAHFLKTFVGNVPWAHLDIAGPSYTEKETRPDQPYGASGYGVRLLARFIQSMGK